MTISGTRSRKKEDDDQPVSVKLEENTHQNSHPQRTWHVRAILKLEDDGEIDHVITQQNSHHYIHQNNHCWHTNAGRWRTDTACLDLLAVESQWLIVCDHHGC